MKRPILFLTIMALPVAQLLAFCGFYVAKADAQMFNESSQVILARNGERTTVTMSSDYQGEMKDFAMVIPVPVVLERSDIKVVDALIFSKLDAYSAPRLAEYYDDNPCYKYEYDMEEVTDAVAGNAYVQKSVSEAPRSNHGVTIQAKYTVGEYDILILSAKQSDGLKIWLTQNGYKIPNAAEEVLDPYIKAEMKFFVVKVNLENQKKQGYQELRPLQITFNSDRFMLPLRLGMANSKGTQDMIVYAFSEKGRVEAANYRTAKIPTDQNIPLFVQERFGEFYVSLFDRAWVREGKNTVMLEYAWDISPRNYVKCDPCVGDPPVVADLQTAGVDWLTYNSKYNINDAQVFFTRLHVRYGRDKFPQDLFFQETPNKEYFQGRYVLHHPVNGELDCSEANNYYTTVFERRREELQNLQKLTGWNTAAHYDYVNDYAKKAGIQKVDKGSFINLSDDNHMGDLVTKLLSAFMVLTILGTVLNRFRN